MALGKSITDTKGITCNYWRIAGLLEYPLLNKSVKQKIILHGFVTEDFRNTEGAEAATELFFNVQNIDDVFTMTRGLTDEYAYTYLKLLPEFEGAVDILEDE